MSTYTVDMMEFVEPLQKEIPEEEEIEPEPINDTDTWTDDDLPEEGPLTGMQGSLF